MNMYLSGFRLILSRLHQLLVALSHVSSALFHMVLNAVDQSPLIRDRFQLMAIIIHSDCQLAFISVLKVNIGRKFGGFRGTEEVFAEWW